MRTDRTQRFKIKGGQRGFTLIELLAVIVILAILSVVLLANLTDVLKTSSGQMTRVLMAKIQVALADYENDQGDWPPSTFTAVQGTPPNLTNLGAECMYIALCAEKAPGFDKFDKELGNTDEDQVPKSFPGFQKPTLFEICDAWGNPIAYFHNRDYKLEVPYVTIDSEGQRIDNVVRAIMNSKTGYFYESTGVQMISAGPDCKFGTDDDITNFKLKQ
jgi:prepilin-type N-terminal cleavage/methylation domain-containing protein